MSYYIVKKLFKVAKKDTSCVPKNSPKLECLHKEVLVFAAAKINLTREFACFSQMDL